MAQFTNQASISYNGITVNSNIVTGEITQVLSATKTATVQSYRDGDIITYVVSIQNSGASSYTGLTITDDLGAYEFGTTPVVPLTYTGDPVLYYVNGRLQASPTVTAGPPLVITGISVPAGQSAELIYRVRLNEYAPFGANGSITNTATITGGGLSELLTASETISADTSPNLSIFKEISPSTVVENGPISYTFVIQNTGADEADAADAIILSDTFNPILEAPIEVTLNGAVLTETGNYTYNQATGEFTTVAGIITVPGATYTQDATSGAWTVTPGVTVVTVSGTI